MTTTIDFSKLLDLIKGEEGFLLTSHQDPDGDSIGSLIGLNRLLKGLGKKTVIFNQGRLPEKYDFLDPAGEIKFAPERIGFEPAVAFVLECPNIERIGFVLDLLKAQMIIVNIDHHTSNTLFGALNYIDEDACAVAEILLNMIRAGGFKITPQIAEPFYAAIASDTGRFKFPNTDANCFRSAAELVEAGANPKLISDKIFSSFSAGTMKLLGHMLNNLELYDAGKICVLKLTLDDLRRFDVKVEDTEGIIDYSLIIAGVKVGILFKEFNPNTIKIGLRSQNGVDISRYAKTKGGGGHPNAAGFTLNDRFDRAVKRTVDEVAEYLDA